MCGIAGVYFKGDPVEGRELASQMGQSLLHRGPDDQGLYAEPGFAMAHCRLAIIDPEHAIQPMHSDSGRFVLSYSGEIYNHQELRRQYLPGHAWRTQSDTETVLALYEHFSEQCFAWLNGMFALAIWDKQQKRLCLARDRFGSKPLYWIESKGYWAFASEIKAFLALPEFSVKLNESALCSYFGFLNSFDQETLFDGVEHFPCAHSALLDSQGSRQESYWRFDYAQNSNLSFKEAQEQLVSLVAGAVRKTHLADVPVGSFLSGGMDSNVIALESAAMRPSWKTLTCGFVQGDAELFEDERSFNELPEVRENIDFFDVQGESIEIGPDRFMQSLRRIVYHLDEPKINSSYAQFLLAETASKRFKVMLSGEGADELMGGYPWRHCATRFAKGSEEFCKAYWQNLNYMKMREDFGEVLFSDQFKAIYQKHQPYKRFQAEIAKIPVTEPLHKALAYDCQKFLHGLMIQSDKIGMAFGLETRFPFLDKDLVDFLLTVPSVFKIPDRDQCKSKFIMRSAYRNRLPEAILNKPKIGIVPPEGSWYRGPLKSYVCDTLLSDRCAARGYFKREGIEQLLSEHFSGKHNYRKWIWAMLSFEQWNRLFIDEQSAQAKHRESVVYA